jgi:SsrA-binding protein
MSTKPSKVAPTKGVDTRIADNKKAVFNYAIGELFLIGCQINPLNTASTHVSPDAVRTKKLLLQKDQIRRLISKVEQKGYTLVPLNLHWENGKVKCEIALGKGKAEHDKRDVIKEREGKREVERVMKSRYR